ncbi:(R)-stereoselective amidase [bacterium HR40]|nr:(R)-stereoselective amidase [bacterium HR40]
MRIAIWQPLAGRRDPAAAMQELEAAVKRAARAGGAWLLAPEFLLPGTADPGLFARFAQPSDGPFPAAVAALARRYRIGIAAGYVEAAFGQLFSAAAVVDMRGIALGHYRRVHLADPERQVLSPGQWTTLLPDGTIRIGILLGADLLVPEAARVLALAGAGLLFACGAPAAVDGEIRRALACARAVENGLPVVLAAFSDGRGWAGGAVDSDGRPIETVALDQHLVLASLTFGQRPALPVRRPDLYRLLCSDGGHGSNILP